MAGKSWSQQIGLTGFPLALVIIALCALAAWWLWLLFRSQR